MVKLGWKILYLANVQYVFFFALVCVVLLIPHKPVNGDGGGTHVCITNNWKKGTKLILTTNNPVIYGFLSLHLFILNLN